LYTKDTKNIKKYKWKWKEEIMLQDLGALRHWNLIVFSTAVASIQDELKQSRDCSNTVTDLQEWIHKGKDAKGKRNDIQS